MTYAILPKRRKRQRAGIRKPSQIRCPQHLVFVRFHGCSIFDLEGILYREPHFIRTKIHACEGKVEAAHVRTGTDGGMALKPGDNWTIPLCAKAHREQHQIGERAFERRYGISMKAIAKGLASLSPALRRQRSKERT